MFSNVSIGSFMGTSELASSLITLATNELSAGSASNAISLLPESENSSFSNAPLTPISAVKGILGNGPWDILFRQYCSVHTLHSLGCCQASPPLLCQASLGLL